MRVTAYLADLIDQNFNVNFARRRYIYIYIYVHAYTAECKERNRPETKQARNNVALKETQEREMQDFTLDARYSRSLKSYRRKRPGHSNSKRVGAVRTLRKTKPGKQLYAPIRFE